MKPQWMLACLLLCLSSLPALHAETDATMKPYEPTAEESPVSKFGWQRYLTIDKFGREITFYLSKRREQGSDPLPLAVAIQGSGSQSVFLEHGEMIASGGPESVMARDFRERARVLVVEKPGVEFLVQPSRPGSSEEGSAEFNREFSLLRWTEAINAAIRAAVKLPGVDGERILALGHSEGGQVACEVAAANPKVTHVAVMAGGGPTQVFDFLQLARQGAMYDPNQTPQQRVDTFLEDWNRVLEDPTATDKFILGHSHLRWSSFTRSSPVEAILETDARVFIAQGTADTNSLPASAEVLYAELLARGRDVTYERVEGGDHAFMTADDTTGKGWFETIGKAMEWFLAGSG
ncbi:hypothetical protein ABI59_12515 [Acidobacteria bacterium Mor1]|nr:hypothetical protein ABI59_12515 [Acidobacteria bacterium Mor1]